MPPAATVDLPRFTPAAQRPIRSPGPVTTEFPVFLPGSAKAAFGDLCPTSIPYERFDAVPHERVLFNHGATLLQLADRGGLDPREIQALFLGVKLTVGKGGDMIEGVEFVKALVRGLVPPPAPWVEPAPKPPRSTALGVEPKARPHVVHAAETAPVQPPPPPPEPRASRGTFDAVLSTPARDAYRKAMRQLGPATMKAICAYSGASKGALNAFLQRNPELVSASPGTGLQGQLWTWIGPLNDAIAPEPALAVKPPSSQGPVVREPLPATELAVDPPEAPEPAAAPSRPSDALIKKRPGGQRGPHRSLTNRYRDVIVALEPAGTMAIAERMGKPPDLVRQYLARHPDLAMVVARRGKQAYWQWIGSRLDVRPLPPRDDLAPTDHLPPVTSAAPEAPVSRPIPPQDAVAEDLTADEDLAPLLGKGWFEDPNDPTVPIPARLLEALLPGPDQIQGVRAMIDYARRVLKKRAS